MSEVRVVVDLEAPRPVYFPGDALAASYRLEADDPCDVKSLELSVLWYTEGKGDEDLGVHYFERLEPPEEERRDFDQRRRLTTTLPLSPLSYDGILVKVRWCVRVRVHLLNGGSAVGETPFQLGDVAPAQEVA